MGKRDEELTKVLIDLPGEKGPSGERLWAKHLGGDLYELRNSPWFAYDLHFYDVVRAVPTKPGEVPRFVKVVRRSGHKTLRVLFAQETAEADRLAMLRELHRWKAFHEHYGGRFYAVGVEPSGDYGAVCDRLWQWEQQGKLVYETGTTGEDG
jgi:hypothetical protein